MDIFKIIGIGIIGAVVTLMLKQTSSEYSVLAVLSTGIIILIMILNSLTDVVLAFNEIVEKSGIESELFNGLLKIVGIGYVTEFSASMCADMNAESIGKKINFAGKITIFLMAMPIVTALIDTVAKLIN